MTESYIRTRERGLGSKEPIRCDTLIIGSGLAGLLLACELMEGGASVVLATKGSINESNTFFAQGGMAAVTSANPLDTPASHVEDTMKSGAGLAVNEVVESIVTGGLRLANRLSELGVNFDRRESGALDLALEGGHQRERVLHSKDTTGQAISQALIDRVLERARASRNGSATAPSLILERALAINLIQEDYGDRVMGALLSVDGQPAVVLAPHVVLATGGIGQIFTRTTNPPVATGDGIALAYRSGATLVDMEFVQFHPTAFCKEGAPAFLVSEAVRGAGAILIDHEGVRFAKRFHPDGELATRDIVSRAIYTTMHQQDISSVFLDMRPIGSDLESRFPKIVKTLRSFGIDPSTTPVPVCPAAHYFMGGIQADLKGTTSLPGLYAIGECASTGLHGANRLASNSLLEAGVMAMSLADHIKGTRTAQPTLNERMVRSLILCNPLRPLVVPTDMDAFKRAMYEGAGLVRNANGLDKLKRTLLRNSFVCNSPSQTLLGHANQLLVGRLIGEAALLRTESRGAHLREDFPETDDRAFKKRLCVRNGDFYWEELAPHGTTSSFNQALVTV